MNWDFCTIYIPFFEHFVFTSSFAKVDTDFGLKDWYSFVGVAVCDCILSWIWSFELSRSRFCTWFKWGCQGLLFKEEEEEEKISFENSSK